MCSSTHGAKVQLAGDFIRPSVGGRLPSLSLQVFGDFFLAGAFAWQIFLFGRSGHVGPVFVLEGLSGSQSSLRVHC